ncbi:nicotinamide riboside transporter PnuC [Hymenobacter agri]
MAGAFARYWQATPRLEIAAVVTGFACVWLAARESIWNFPVAIVSCVLYAILFWQTKFYADFGLQGFFIALSFYGWYKWLYGDRDESVLGITRTTGREWLISTAFVGLFTLGFGYYLHAHTDAALPHIDSFTTAGSLVAQYLLTRKRVENWLLWLFVDLIYVPMYWNKGLYISSLLYFLYLALAAYGYWQWRRELRATPVAPAAN